MYQVCFYVPASHLEEVKNAMFEAGAGNVGHYSHCAWQTLGEGQFLPKAGSHAFTGEEGHMEKISEYKVEMVCDDMRIQDVMSALRKSHPYEEPAYHVWRLENI